MGAPAAGARDVARELLDARLVLLDGDGGAGHQLLVAARREHEAGEAEGRGRLLGRAELEGEVALGEDERVHGPAVLAAHRAQVALERERLAWLVAAK